MKVKDFDKFNDSSDVFLKNISPYLNKETDSVICFSFLKYLAATCIVDKETEYFKRTISRDYEDCLDFFHTQLDYLYEDIKRNADGYANKES